MKNDLSTVVDARAASACSPALEPARVRALVGPQDQLIALDGAFAARRPVAPVAGSVHGTRLPAAKGLPPRGAPV